MTPEPPSPFWARDRHADRRGRLAARARIVTALRGWFSAEGFVEVEPAILQVSPGNETHLHAFETSLRAFGGGERRLFLHTSPEFAMKKLVAAGEDKIVAFARVFRNRETGPLHAPEFTMVEWYRAGRSYEALMEDGVAVLRLAAGAAGGRELRHRGRTADAFAEPERLSVEDAFRRHAGFSLLATLDGVAGNRDRLAAAAGAAGLRVSEDDTWSDVFSRVLAERIEPRLGQGRATILADYPVIEAALARPKPADRRLAERFELYACGVELANAFGELTDPVEQRARLEHEMAEKQRLFGERYPLDEDFLAALARMPETSGIALGLDRLVMLATGAECIEDVQWTPLEAGR